MMWSVGFSNKYGRGEQISGRGEECQKVKRIAKTEEGITHLNR